MNEVEKKLEIVKDELYSNPLVLEYFRLKKSIEEDKELMELDKKIRTLQKELCYKNNKENIDNNESYMALKARFDNHPLVINYNKVKEEVFDLLNEIEEVFR